jgi:hypothetical protein
LPDQSDDLENFFRLEKRIVFALLADLGIQLTEAEQDAIDEVPTRNLQAFLAYSRGLAAEDQQDFGAAADFFGQAVQIDPGFEIASVEGETAEGMSETFGSVDNALSSARQLEPLTTNAIDPLSDRLTNLGISIEAPVVPGTDARKPAVEGTMTSPDLLPDPPDPPIRN